MKSNPRLVAFLQLAALFASAHSARADDTVKANNLTAMNQAASWTGNQVPNASNTIVFNDIYTQTGSFGTGAPLSYLGVRVEGSSVNTLININNTSAANHVAPGVGGIDMSTSPRNLTIQSLQVNTAQTWNIGASRTLALGGTKLAGSGQVTVVGPGFVSLGANNTLTNGFIVDGARITTASAGGLGTAAVTQRILDGGGAFLSAAVTIPANFEIAGIGWSEPAGFLGAIRLTGTTVSGDILLKSNSRITAHGSTGTLSGVISDGGENFALDLGNYSTGGNTTLTLSGDSPNTYTGGTTVTGAVVRGLKDGAFGTGPITVQGNGTTARITRLEVEGITLDNNIFLSSNALTNFRGALHAAGGTVSTINGTVTIDTPVGNGGHLAAENNTTSVLRLMGPIHVSGAVTTPSIRFGTVEVGGGGNYGLLSHLQGTLRLAADDGINSEAALSSGGSGLTTFDLNGYDQTLSRFNTTSFATTVTNDHLSDTSTLTLTGPDDNSIGVFNPGSSPLNIITNGSGALRFTGNSTGAAPGTVTVNDGSLVVTGKLGGSATSVVVADGVTLSGNGTIGGNVALGSTTGARLQFNPSAGIPLWVEGDVVVNGVLEVTPAGGSSSSPFEILEYSGNLTATPASFSAPSFRGPVFNVGSGTNDKVILSLSAAEDVTWTGSVDNLWVAGGDLNWTRPGSVTERFYEFDQVSFTDSATGSGEITISIPSGVLAGEITFDHSLKDFRIAGPGVLSGGNLVKKGSGTATLAAPGGNSGWTDIEAGTLVFDFTQGNPASATTDIDVFAGATLRLAHDDGAFTFNRPVRGDGSVVINPHAAIGSATAHSVTWTGSNPDFAGNVILASPASGTSRLSAGSVTLGTATLLVQPDNQLFASADQTYNNDITITGDGFEDTGGFLGALRLSNNTVWNGSITVTGTPGDSGGIAADASIGLFSATATINGPVTGGDVLFAGYNTNVNETFSLTAANDFGDLIVAASDSPTAGQVTAVIGNLGLAATNTNATLGSGDVHLIGGAGGKAAALRIQRSDGYLLEQDILGAGNKDRTVLIVDVLGDGLSLNGRTVDIGEQVRLGGNVDGGILNIDPGSTVNAGFFFLGNAAGNSSTVNQTGGSVVVGGHIRIAHWPNETSVWNMTDGSLTLTGIPASPSDGGPGGGGNESPGILYVGIDGQGIFNQSGGTVSAYGLVLDNRGNSGPGTNMLTGIDEYNLTGGTLTLNASGIRGNASTAFNLGGGVLAASESFASTLPLNVTANGSVLQTNGFDITLGAGMPGEGSVSLGGSGRIVFDHAADLAVVADLSGTAGLRKEGSGKLTLAGANTYSGKTEVWVGTLAIAGSLSGTDLELDGGALVTGGSLAGNLTLSPSFASDLAYGGSPLAVTGNVTISGSVDVDPLANGPVAAGSHPLITFTGSLSGSVANFGLPVGFSPADYRQGFSFSAAPNAVNLVVTGSAGDLVWDGPGDWDLNDATSWGGGEKFFIGDAVTFNDTAASGNVSLVGSLSPSSITVDNSSLDYTFSGSGSISGAASLLKQGSGTLTLSTTNDHSGGTTVRGGTLVVDAVGALGSGTATVSSGTLKINPAFAVPVTVPIILGDAQSGSAETILELPVNAGTGGDAVTLSTPLFVSSDAPGSKAILRYPGGTSGAAMSYNGTITLQNRDLHIENTSDVNPNNRLWNLSGRITGTGNLHIDVPSGATRVRLRGTSNDFIGDVFINSGHLQTFTGGGGVANCIPDHSSVFVAAGATLALGASDAIDALTGAGEIRANLSGSTQTVTLTVGTNNGSGTFDGSTLDLFNSPGGGRVAFVKTGSGTQVLNGPCAHLGASSVNGGVLVINDSFAAPVTVGGSGTLMGSGTLASSLTATASGARVNPGNSTGTLSSASANFSGGGTLVIELDDAASPKNDTLAVSGSLDITEATLDVLSLGSTPSQTAYVIATYGSLNGEFATTNLPAGYEVNYAYEGNQIALVRTSSDDYGTWAASFGLNPETTGAPDVDFDGDGLSNRLEYAFGLSPINPASASPVTVPLDPAAGTLTYTRRDPALTGLSYAAQTSTTLAIASWATDGDALHSVIATNDGIQTVRVTLSPALLSNPRLFARIVATGF